MLDNIRKIDPSALPMKVRQIVRSSRGKAAPGGHVQGSDFYITAGMEEAIRHGVFMMLPRQPRLIRYDFEKESANLFSQSSAGSMKAVAKKRMHGGDARRGTFRRRSRMAVRSAIPRSLWPVSLFEDVRRNLF